MKRKNYSMGGCVDERIPRDEISKIVAEEGIDPDPFCDWLARQVGTYRFLTEMRSEAPTRAEEIKVLRDFQQAMDAAIHYLSHGSLTPSADAMLWAEWWKFTKTPLDPVTEDMVQKMRRLMVMAGNIEREFEATPQKRGAKRDQRRDNLLRDVVTQFKDAGLKTQQARKLAAFVLDRCGIANLPDSDRALRRAQTRGTK